MAIKKWLFSGLALVMVTSLVSGCTNLQARVPDVEPQADQPSQMIGEGWVDSLWELNDYWEGQVHLEDLVGSQRDYYIEQATGLIYGIPEVADTIETEIIQLDLVSADVFGAQTPGGDIVVVSIPGYAGDDRAAITVAMPQDGGEPLIMGFISNIFMLDYTGRVVVYPAFLIRGWWWIDGHIVWWNYWWYDSHNHPNWYYSWWYWYYRYFEYYGHYWYGWYTWYYSWFYWDYWWYWSTWWAF